MRCEQADKLTAWIATHSRGVPVVAVGDFNCIPQSAPLRVMASHLTSVFDRLGAEAPPTAPTRLEVPPRYPGVWPVDHIFVSEGVRVLDGSRVFDQSDAKDAALYPSDHFGLVATIDLGGSA
jgi:endonuclease/exonuclease/phosphatase family metal-dependent hydrolase